MSEKHYDAEYFDNRYEVVRKDRDLQETGKCKGGGVLIAAKESMKMQFIGEIRGSSLGAILIKLTVNHFKFYICAVYFPPSSCNDLYDELFQFTESLCPQGSAILLVGDFNLPEISETALPERGLSAKCQTVANYIAFNDLLSVNDVKNNNNRTLDLVLTNLKTIVYRETNPLVREDVHHPSLFIRLALGNSVTRKLSVKNQIRPQGYNFRKGNYSKLYDLLSKVNWNCLNMYEDVDAAVDVFYNIIYSIFDDCFPEKKQTTRNYPCWFTGDIIKKTKN